MTAPSIAVVITSTRPRRNGPLIAGWVLDELADVNDFTLSLVDLADVQLPLLDEPEPALSGSYSHDHTRRWSGIVDSHDGFILVTPEHNRSMPASLKNALDCLHAEWAHKPVGFVSYSGGLSGGIRAVEMTRQVASTLSMLAVNDMVNLPRIDTLTTDGLFTPPDGAADALHELADSLPKYLAASAVLRAA